jgi:hypothetical protein
MEAMMKRWTILPVLFLLFTSLACEFSTSSTPEKDFKLPVIHGQVGGEIKNYIIRGNYIYAGSGPTLIIIDQTDRKDPSLVGQSVVMPDIVQDIAVQGDYAYVAAGRGGLRIFDISDPANPREVGFFTEIDYAAFVAVSSGYAYVAGNEALTSVKGHGLYIVDIIDPKDPTKSSYYRTNGYPKYLYYHNQFVYLQIVSEDSNKKTVIDILTVDVRDAAKPDEEASYRLTRDASNVAEFPFRMVENLAFVANKDEFRILDFRNPGNPLEVGKMDSPLKVCGIAISGDSTYLIGERAGVAIIDSSNHKDLKQAGFYQSFSAGCNIQSQDKNIYISVHNGLEIVDASDPFQPFVNSLYLSPVEIDDVAVEGDYAYVVSATSKFHIVNIKDRFYPDLVGYLDGEVDQPVVIRDNMAYLGGSGLTLLIADIAEKDNPEEKGRYTPPSGTPIKAQSILLSGNYAYLAAGPDGLLVMDIRDPAKPERVILFETASPIRDLVLRNRSLHASARNGGLLIIGIDTPDAPKEIKIFDDIAFAGHAIIDDKYAYIAGERQIFIVDVSDRAKPRLSATYYLEDAPLAMAFHRNRLYVVDALRNLITLEIRDRTRLQELYRAVIPCTASSLKIAHDYLFVGAKKCGLFILPISELD